MKQIQVVAAIIHDEEENVLATQRGYGEYEGWWEFSDGNLLSSNQNVVSSQRNNYYL